MNPLVIGVVLGAVGMFVALGVIGYLFMERESGVLFEEDFNSSSPEFPTDSDPLVDLSVVNGAYRILIKDASDPQLVRHVFDHSNSGLRFEATVTIPKNGALFSVGCWSSASGYLFAMADTGEVAVFESHERTGKGRLLKGPIKSQAVVGQPNRLRVDCVGGGHDPTVISGWVNGEPIVSVEVPVGYDSFDAVGFRVWSETDGAVFLVDDVTAVAERPSPGKSPVPPSPA
jgi:hypothetical protein